MFITLAEGLFEQLSGLPSGFPTTVSATGFSAPHWEGRGEEPRAAQNQIVRKDRALGEAGKGRKEISPEHLLSARRR